MIDERPHAPPGDCAELLTPPHNNAVVQLPSRRYPGVVVQGDSLYSLWSRANEATESAKGTRAEDEVRGLSEALHSILLEYMQVLEEHDIALPFSYAPPGLT